jgi:hypothetical protein
MDELGSVLDALAADDLDGLVASQMLDHTTLLVKARTRIDAELTRTVRKGENIQAPEHDGLKSMRSWLRGHARLSARAAHRLVSNGWALERLPGVAAGFAAGAVTAEQVAVVTPVAAVDVQAEAVGQGVDLAAVDATLAEVAATRVHAQLGRGGGALPGPPRSRRHRTGPDRGPVADPVQARRRQPVHPRRAGCGGWGEALRRAGLENSALLCERHHTKVHHGFRVERPPDGRWRTWRPDGTDILLAEPLLTVH